MKKRKYLFLIWFLVGFLALVNLIASNQMSNSGEKIRALEKEITALARENLDLGQQIAVRSSLLELKERARSLGFSASTKIFYLKGETVVAMR